MKSPQQMCNCMDIYKRCFSWRKCVQTVGAFWRTMYPIQMIEQLF